MLDGMEMLCRIINAAEDRKAADIEILKVRELTVLSDYFVICTGTSTTQVKAIADWIELKLKEEGITADHIEGYASASWVLMDYGNVLVHVFLNEARQFYLLERLWGDAEKIDVSAFLGNKGEEK